MNSLSLSENMVKAFQLTAGQTIIDLCVLVVTHISS